ncbi:MAG TPA: cytochrome c [Fibrobacteraceae bacterium]|jgi:mono/diheme cytochrome c family protein|nr:cytochrome c [Fibrobacter sp.]HPW93605.1 cytochrome c [Fibrobacteraceae bacterium]
MRETKKIWLSTIFIMFYGILLGNMVFAEDTTNSLNPMMDKPAPGSKADTLTREDARMAYLIYNLLDENKRIKGANLKRGAELFYMNCRACHGDDGRRVNFTPNKKTATYLGTTARNEMPTFWYLMNFGDGGRGMLPYIDEIPLEDMIDIAGFAQTLPE